jgi:hypothetical protein
MNKSTVLILCAATLLLAACGGGSDTVVEIPAATDGVPDSASASAAGMAAWMTDLAAAPSDTKEPLDVAKFTPASSDDTEPETVK